MSIVKRQDFLLNLFEKFSKTTERITFQLNQLTQLLKLESHPAEVILKYLANHQKKSMVTLKWLVLINKLIIEFAIDTAQIMEVLEGIQCDQVDHFDQLLSQKLINPYKLYLMKRCQFLPKKSSDLDRMYQLLNLIHSATSFSEVIYTLGRYYAQTYKFSIDFNVVLGNFLFILGNDLATVYKQMIKYSPRPAGQQILQQFEKLHEKMYVIYYNCYFYKHLKPFVPRWVVTDVDSLNSTQIKSVKTTVTSNKSMVQTATSLKMACQLKQKNKNSISLENIDMSSSSIFQNSSTKKDKKMEESILLLKSMERVFEQIQDF